MVWFTSGDVDAAVGTSTRTKVSPNTADFTAAEERARLKVRAAYLQAGYSLQNTSPTALAKHLAIAQWVLERFGVRKGFVVPQPIKDLIDQLDLIRTGEMPDPDATANVRDGVGGHEFSVSDPQTFFTTGARPSVFDRDSLRRW